MARPTLMRMDVAFRVKGLGSSTVVDIDLTFEIDAPAPTVYVFERGDWQPSAQRAWTDDDLWFPGVL